MEEVGGRKTEGWIVRLYFNFKNRKLLIKESKIGRSQAIHTRSPLSDLQMVVPGSQGPFFCYFIPNLNLKKKRLQCWLLISRKLGSAFVFTEVSIKSWDQLQEDTSRLGGGGNLWAGGSQSWLILELPIRMRPINQILWLGLLKQFWGDFNNQLRD